jgi:hypothetical protein
MPFETVRVASPPNLVESRSEYGPRGRSSAEIVVARIAPD